VPTGSPADSAAGRARRLACRFARWPCPSDVRAGSPAGRACRFARWSCALDVRAGSPAGSPGGRSRTGAVAKPPTP